MLELAAASWAIDYFAVYLRGKHFELFTDHKPLETLNKVHKETLNRRNMALKTDCFLYTMSDESGDIIAEQKNYHFDSDVRDFFLKSKSPKGSPGYNT